MGRVILDSSVLLALLDPGDALHASARQAVSSMRHDGHELAVPASVLSECLVRAHRQGGSDTAADVEKAIDRIAVDVLPLDRRIARVAAALRAQQKALRLPDALVIATATATGAFAVLTGDKRWDGVDPLVEIVTPHEE
ncbi:type II toxin-antitoxin system VapC family toxin [Streptomyces sp. CMB-StM0423]|uniref:type II toxin-antitoxin system VapC family toxin n=1 Tax=Streptomyces sp. CMB-StM0423 TaxID=2059884 RepID=UPI000C70B201|nr:PIN domain-containing protein [Streptomyces sp. CMB-StM0423]AUH43226.1 hypothetical protein CXR04_26405 [Streptomyces sp. CMB-StM0423]